MLASVVIVIVVLGDVNIIPWHMCCLFNQQMRVWMKSLLTKMG